CVQSATRVRVVARVVVDERLNDRGRTLRRRGAIEISKRLTVHLLLQHGEIVAPLLRWARASGRGNLGCRSPRDGRKPSAQRPFPQFATRYGTHVASLSRHSS